MNSAVPHVRRRRCPAGASVQGAPARPLRAVADRSRHGAPALCRRARISSHRHDRARRQAGGGVHVARHRSPFARRHSRIDRRGRAQGALRERRVRQPDLVPGRHARGGRQCARVFRAAPGDHQPARAAIFPAATGRSTCSIRTDTASSSTTAWSRSAGTAGASRRRPICTRCATASRCRSRPR